MRKQGAWGLPDVLEAAGDDSHKRIVAKFETAIASWSAPAGGGGL